MHTPFVPSGGPAQRSGFAVAALTLGIVGLVLFVTVVPSILAVIFGAIGIRQTGGGRRSGRGMAIAGLILGLIGVAIAVALWGWIAFSGECSWDNGELFCESS